MQQRVWIRPENASNVQIPNAGHLVRIHGDFRVHHIYSAWKQIPQEAPRQLGMSAGRFWLNCPDTDMYLQALDIDNFLRQQYGLVKARL